MSFNLKATEGRAFPQSSTGEEALNSSLALSVGLTALWIGIRLDLGNTMPIILSLISTVGTFVTLHFLWNGGIRTINFSRSARALVSFLNLYSKWKRKAVLVVLPLVLGIAPLLLLSAGRLSPNGFSLGRYLAVAIAGCFASFIVFAATLPLRAGIWTNFRDTRISFILFAPIIISSVVVERTPVGLVLCMSSLLVGVGFAAMHFNALTNRTRGAHGSVFDGLVVRPRGLIEREIWSGRLSSALLLLWLRQALGRADERKWTRAQARIAFRMSNYRRIVELSIAHRRSIPSSAEPSAVVISLTAQAWLRLGRRHRAERLLKMALQRRETILLSVDSNSTQRAGLVRSIQHLKVSLAHLAWVRGDQEDAIALSESVLLEQDADQCPAAANNLAYYLARHCVTQYGRVGRNSEACQAVLRRSLGLVRSALEGNISLGLEAECHDTEGFVLSLMGRARDAERSYLRAAEFDRPSAHCTFHMGMSAMVDTLSYQRAELLLLLAREEHKRECPKNGPLDPLIDLHLMKLRQARRDCVALSWEVFWTISEDVLPIAEGPAVPGVRWLPDSLGRVLRLSGQAVRRSVFA